MRTNFVLLALVCLFAAMPATAEIARISPVEFNTGGEDNLVITGQNLLGTAGTQLLFDGVLAIEPTFASDDELISWVPVEVLRVDGQHTVTVRSIDANGVRLHGPVTFIVHAAGFPTGGAPFLILPESVVAVAKGRDGAVVRFEASAYDAVGAVDVACAPASGSLFPLGNSMVSCSASNLAGTTVETFPVLVTDATAPEVRVSGDIITDQEVVTFTATASDDIDGALPVRCSPASGSSFPFGRTLVTCSATDAHLNVGAETFMVIRTGGVPTLNLPSAITREATGANGAVVTFTTSSSDGSPVVCAPASGATFALGATTVNCSATNASGTANASFSVTVVDTTAPVITAPAVTADATSGAGANVAFSVTATDLVDGNVSTTCTPASGSFFALGDTNVTCTAKDARLNAASATFVVTVRDVTPPQIVSITASPNVLWPPDHKMVDAVVSVVAVDADPLPLSRIVSVSSNQPVEGTGDGDTAPDWKITGPLTLQLRAERSASKDRIYTITVQTSDASGNMTTSTVEVRVTDPKRRSSR